MIIRGGDTGTVFLVEGGALVVALAHCTRIVAAQLVDPVFLDGLDAVEWFVLGQVWGMA
jgi:hypothetical protein